MHFQDYFLEKRRELHELRRENLGRHDDLPYEHWEMERKRVQAQMELRRAERMAAVERGKRP